jgi:hypothetical protein
VIYSFIVAVKVDLHVCWQVKDARTGPGLKSINKLKYKKAGSSSGNALPSQCVAKKLNSELSLMKENSTKLKHSKLDFDGLDGKHLTDMYVEYFNRISLYFIIGKM